MSDYTLDVTVPAGGEIDLIMLEDGRAFRMEGGKWEPIHNPNVELLVLVEQAVRAGDIRAAQAAVIDAYEAGYDDGYEQGAADNE